MTTVLTVTLNPTLDISASSDTVVPIRKNRCSELEYCPGGGGINVARVLTRFGAGTTALYARGGPIGALVERLLAEEGVAGLPVAIAADTRESVTVYERTTGQEYRFVFPGPHFAPGEWEACLDRIAGLAEPPAYIVASGSLPPGVPSSFYGDVARIAHDMGAAFVLDSSGPALAAGLDAGVHLVKPNLHELEDLTGRSLDSEAALQEAARGLVTGGRAEIVAVSLGADGALLATADLLCRAPGLHVPVRSAVGAGDSFVAAMVWALAGGLGCREAFRYGIAAGTAALLTPGTELCRMEDVERLLREVQVTDC